MSFRFPVTLVILELLPLMVLAWIWLRRGNGISLPLDHAVGRAGVDEAVVRWKGGSVVYRKHFFFSVIGKY